MILRTAVREDTDQIKNIWKCCFDDSDSFLSWNFSKNYSHLNTVVAEENGKIISNLQIIPYTVYINKTPVSMGYISGAATLPEHRYKGCMNALIPYAFEQMLRRGQKISMLIPFSYEFYEKYGFKLCYNFRNYNLNISDILPDASGYRYRRGNITPDDIQAMDSIYKQFTTGKNAFVLRDAHNWHLILEDLIFNDGGDVCFCVDAHGNRTGYMMYIKDDRHIKVSELAYTDSESQRALSAFAKTMYSEADCVSINATQNDMSFDSLCSNRAEISVIPFAMARITDVSYILSLFARRVPSGESVSIGVEDNYILQNNGTYIIKDGIIRKEDGFAAESTAQTDIQTLTQLAMGYITPKQAWLDGTLCGDFSPLENIFLSNENYINMLFN